MDLHGIVKKEIKEEALDDFLPECLLTVHELEDQAGLEHDFKTETQPPSSPTLSCKEETEHVEENHDNDFPTTSKKLERLFSVAYICYIINNNNRLHLYSTFRKLKVTSKGM